MRLKNNWAPELAKPYTPLKINFCSELGDPGEFSEEE
jgi:hypothetical protein